METIAPFIPPVLIILAIIGFNILKYFRYKKYPINHIGPFVFPMPNDPRWKHDKEDRYCLDKIAVYYKRSFQNIYVNYESLRTVKGVKHWQIERYCEEVYRSIPTRSFNEIQNILKAYQ